MTRSGQGGEYPDPSPHAPRRHQTVVMPTARRNDSRIGSIVLALLALAVAGLASTIVFGFTSEYGGGVEAWGLMTLVTPVLMCAVLAAGSVALWPGPWSGMRTLVAGGAVLVAVGGIVGGLQLGEWHNERRHERESATFTCNGRNAEITADPRIDRAFDALPRPALIYGPVAGSATHCVAGIDGSEDSFDKFARAFRSSGWTVVRDTDDKVAVERADVRATVFLQGDPQAPDRQALFKVEVLGR